MLLHAFAANCHFKGIEIHAHEIDRQNPVLGHALHMIRNIAATE